MAEIIPDSAIYDFLITKGVDVEKPKRSKDIKGRAIDGAITGLNPIARFLIDSAWFILTI